MFDGKNVFNVRCNKIYILSTIISQYFFAIERRFGHAPPQIVHFQRHFVQSY